MTENELLSYLVELCEVPPIEPDEVTPKMLAARIGKTDDRARDQLNRLVSDGVLTKRKVRLLDGSTGYAYRKATSDD